MEEYLAGLTTEQINEDTKMIDQCSSEEMVLLINEQDALVAASVRRESKNISAAIDCIYEAFQKGGRLIYIGAGSSGRLGVLDASECLPTFGIAPKTVQGYIAGGDIALRTPVEGCEDDEGEGVALINSLNITEKDVVIGITASGSTKFVLAAVLKARELGAKTVGIVTNANSKLSKIVDICIAPLVGPEVITGSTRMKSGTAQKMVLNMLTTCTMIKMGKVYDNLMVDLKVTNEKLQDRAIRLICYATGAAADMAKEYLQKANGHVKLAILMIKTGLDANGASRLLENYKGHLKQAISGL